MRRLLGFFAVVAIAVTAACHDAPQTPVAAKAGIADTADQVFFGATVEYARKDDSEHKVTIVGVDEADLTSGKISWLSPVARALMRARIGDVVECRTPSGPDPLEILSIEYAKPN